MLIQLFRNAQLLVKQNVTNANHAVQHTNSSPRSGIYQCIARNEYGSKQSPLYATVSGKRYHVVVHCRVVLRYCQYIHCYTVGVAPDVSATSRSPTTTSPSMPQSTDYVTTSQSTPRASSTSTSSSYSSQPTNAS